MQEKSFCIEALLHIIFIVLKVAQFIFIDRPKPVY